MSEVLGPQHPGLWPQGKFSQALEVEAWGVHTLLGMPVPWVLKLGFASWRLVMLPITLPAPECGKSWAMLGLGPFVGCWQLLV